jgi:recombination protein RecA
MGCQQESEPKFPYKGRNFFPEIGKAGFFSGVGWSDRAPPPHGKEPPKISLRAEFVLPAESLFCHCFARWPRCFSEGCAPRAGVIRVGWEDTPGGGIGGEQPQTKEREMSKKPEGKDTVATLDAVIAQIRKEFGDGAIMRMGEVEVAKQIPSVSTGAFSLDMALGIGGLPRGRVVEIFGPEASGKTTLALHIIANAQKAGGMAAFVDAEHAMDPAYAKRIGVNMVDLLVSQPASGEEALTITETLVRSNALDVVVIDSVAALAPRAELDGNMGDAYVGLQARLMSQAMRKLTAAIATSKTLCVFTNQIREKIGVMFGNPETTPGGRALKFYASVRLDIRRVASLKDPTGKVIGNHTRVKVVKNKVAPPFTEAEFDIFYAKGISWEGSVLDAGLAHGLVTKKGSWLSFENEQIGQGQDAAREFLEQNPQTVQKLIQKIKERLEAAP